MSDTAAGRHAAANLVADTAADWDAGTDLVAGTEGCPYRIAGATGAGVFRLTPGLCKKGLKTGTGHLPVIDDKIDFRVRLLVVGRR